MSGFGLFSVKKLRAVNSATSYKLSTECGFSKSDIAFISDSSESVSEANFLKMKSFLKKIAEETDTRDTTRIASVSYNHFTYINFYLDENKTVSTNLLT